MALDRLDAVSRRGFLKSTAALSAGAFALGRSSAAPVPLFAPPPIRVGDTADIQLFMKRGTRQILPGKKTNVWSYSGWVTSGRGDTLRALSGTHLGPAFQARRGQHLIVRMRNDLYEPTITHWHGLDVEERNDGHPMYAVPDASTYVYDFTVMNRAGTYWYHPHPDMRTGTQAYMGLAGFFLVSDDEEDALALPRGARDVPLCLQDATFDADNQWFYNPNMRFGFLGNSILVNGNPNAQFSCGSRVYRFRLLNGSQSRVFKLAFDDGTPIIVIGTDGGLVETPVQLPFVTLAPGERVDLWVDFRGKTLNSTFKLVSLPFTGYDGAQGAGFNIMTCRIAYDAQDSLVLPSRLSTIPRYRLEDAVNRDNPRVFPITFMSGMGYMLNGRHFEMMETAPNEEVRCGDLEVVTITNTSGVAAQQVGHPMHFHGRQFQVLDRTPDPARLAAWQSVAPGFTDFGWKDTVLVMPGETIRLLIRYSIHPGLFVYHCHNLHHEDMGMMRNLRLT